MSQFVTKLAVGDDVRTVAELLNEIDAFYGDEVIESFEERLARVDSTLFGAHPMVYAILARADNGDVVGLATISYLWPAAGSTSSLYLKELFVRPGHRGKGAGKALMQAVFDQADKSGCSRVEWTTDRSNEEAQRFYESLSVAPHDGKIFYRRTIS
ncbi:GNAT family N-acetyltransferase [Saccharothrix violaceirubra]|uniref:GNAT superfamily N-acetyltransferase n=1 Tax=Saccharothrix violaceirubra TaxID=413306 RepID=A0A7W7WW93_9PSEU|nr:GNAT family N-acetyltransferase [Saccharothrix violaceirubra]MBB4966154.1 GNAT superfamily N-acetyltransferase [Saccharothrix violaceirubra]